MAGKIFIFASLIALARAGVIGGVGPLGLASPIGIAGAPLGLRSSIGLAAPGIAPLGLRSSIGLAAPGIGLASPAIAPLGLRSSIGLAGPAIAAPIGLQSSIGLAGPAIGAPLGLRSSIGLAGPAIAAPIGLRSSIGLAGPAIGLRSPLGLGVASPLGLRAGPIGLAGPAVVAAPALRAVAAPAYAKTVVADEYDPHPQYSYAYDVQDALTGDSKSQQETRSGDVVQGSYSLVEPDGTRRIVDYAADPVNGFNAVVRKEPLVTKAVVAAPAIGLASKQLIL